MGYGVINEMVKWFEDFLSFRRQRVTIEEASYLSRCLSRVPQGSVLGPLLFVIYINEMPDKIVNVTKLFADIVNVTELFGKNHLIHKG